MNLGQMRPQCKQLWFALDFLSSIPIETTEAAAVSPDRRLDTIRMLRLLKTVRAAKLLNLWVLFHLGELTGPGVFRFGKLLLFVFQACGFRGLVHYAVTFQAERQHASWHQP